MQQTSLFKRVGLCVIGICLFFLEQTSRAGTDGPLTYQISEGAVEITDCDESAIGSLIIPDQIEGKTVTSIGHGAFNDCSDLTDIKLASGISSLASQAFFDCTSLTNITLPSGLLSIGAEAFYRCRSLEAIEFPDGLQSIGRSSFSFCNALESVDIPPSVFEIGERPFFSCNNLNTIHVDTANFYYTDVDGVLFDKPVSTLIQMPGNRQGSYSLPETVTHIGESAFAYSELSSISFPADIAEMGGHVFFWCDNLSAIHVDSANSTYASIDGVLFDKAITELIRCPVKKSGAYAVPGTVSTISDLAFQDCTDLTGISLPASLKSIGDRSFERCSGISDILLPNGVTHIGEWAFYFCSKIRNVNIPESVITIDAKPFSCCTILESITVDPDNPQYTSLDGILFTKDLSRLIQVPPTKAGEYIVPPSVTTIGDSAFYRCDQLTNIVFPDGLSTIGSYAFRSCTGLQEILLPRSLTLLDYGAFDRCSNLSRAVFEGNAPSLGYHSIFTSTDPYFSVYFFSHNNGFSSPTWNGYPAQSITDNTDIWLNKYHLPLDTEIGLQDKNGDGVTLLMAFALNLDPGENLSRQLPEPTFDSDSMKLRFYANADGVTYLVETSENLISWTTSGVVITDLDEYRTASIHLDSAIRFFRLKVSK